MKVNSPKGIAKKSSGHMPAHRTITSSDAADATVGFGACLGMALGKVRASLVMPSNTKIFCIGCPTRLTALRTSWANKPPTTADTTGMTLPEHTHRWSSDSRMGVTTAVSVTLLADNSWVVSAFMAAASVGFGRRPRLV